jgi:hypothetical protein
MVGELEFVGLWVSIDRRELQEIIKTQDAETGGALQQEVEQVGCRPDVGESSVGWLVRECEMMRKSAEFAIRHFFSNQPSSEAARINHPVGEWWPAVENECSVEETQIETDVVANDHTIANKLPQRLQHELDSRSGDHHCGGDAGEKRNLGRNLDARVDQRLELADAPAALKLCRRDLRDAARLG